MRGLLLVPLTLLLSACVARTALDVVALPVKAAGIGVKAVGAGVDAVTVSQAEADRKRGREIREREERLGREARRRERERQVSEGAEPPH